MASVFSTMWSTRSLSSRTMRPKSTVSSSSSAVSSVAAASASRCSRASRARTSGRTSGASPGITRTSPSKSGSSEKTVRPTLTASPVPRCTRCSTNSIGISVAICSCRVFVTRSAPWPTTITMRSSGSATSASTTWRSIGRPHNGWSTLGVSERMRVPSPAASTMAANGRYPLNAVSVPFAMVASCPVSPASAGGSAHFAFLAQRLLGLLGGEVSNLDLGLQRTPCCRYTTPDRLDRPYRDRLSAPRPECDIPTGHE